MSILYNRVTVFIEYTIRGDPSSSSQYFHVQKRKETTLKWLNHRPNPSTLVPAIYKNDVQLVMRSIFIYTFELNSNANLSRFDSKDGSFQVFSRRFSRLYIQIKWKFHVMNMHFRDLDLDRIYSKCLTFSLIGLWWWERKIHFVEFF